MKINVKQVLSESLSFYKKNFTDLMGIPLIIFAFVALVILIILIPSIISKGSGNILWSFLHQSQIYLFYSVVVLVASIVTIIFFPKLYLAMSILINSLFGENKMTTKQAYDQTKGKYWPMIGCSFLVALWYIPIIVIILLVKIPFANLLNSIYAAFVSSFYYTLFPMIAIEPRTNHYLRKSNKMIKGNYFSALTLIFITSTLLTIITEVLTHIFQGTTAKLLISAIVCIVAFLFLYPFNSTVTVIVYRQLKENQEPIEPIETEQTDNEHCENSGNVIEEEAHIS